MSTGHLTAARSLVMQKLPPDRFSIQEESMSGSIFLQKKAAVMRVREQQGLACWQSCMMQFRGVR